MLLKRTNSNLGKTALTDPKNPIKQDKDLVLVTMDDQSRRHNEENDILQDCTTTQIHRVLTTLTPRRSRRREDENVKNINYARDARQYARTVACQEQEKTTPAPTRWRKNIDIPLALCVETHAESNNKR